MPLETKTFLNPADCLNMSFEQSVGLLKNKIGKDLFTKAFNIEQTIKSPVADCKDTSWAQTLKIIGINPRITKTFWGIVKYALTFPEQGIHLMPLFETGDSSIYMQNSWELNKDFFDNDLSNLGYKTTDEQLKLVINVLHAMGKVVGFDALAHVDNFSEIVLLNPKLFEWVKLNDDKTAQIPFDKIDYNEIYLEVQNIITNTLNLDDNIFDLAEKQRKELIFPKNIDKFERRMELRHAIRNAGIEPIPVVEHAPNRPIIFDKFEKKDNESWATFKVENISNSAKIFGSLTPYKLYKTDDTGYPKKNDFWAESWDYFSDKINEFQNKFNFDFLRADMAHNQISHSHREENKDINCPELWTYVKSNINENKPWFVTVAEAFFGTYYIDGISDMINKDFDIIIGNMNFKSLNKEYINLIDDYVNPFRKNFYFYPSVTIFTNDGDLKKHNKCFPSDKQNLLRCFISLFLNLPSYMGMGFELRDIDPKYPENYSNPYVIKQEKDYRFGENISFFNGLSEIRSRYMEMKNITDTYELELIYSKNNDLSLCFEYKNNDSSYLIVANLNENSSQIELIKNYKEIELLFSQDKTINLENNQNMLKINIKPWEFAIFKCKI